MGHVKVSSVKERDIDEVTLFAINSFHEKQKHVPILQSSPEQSQAFLHGLRRLIKEAPSVAAYEDGRLTGFLMGLIIPSWRGRKTVYCPEWAHVAVGKKRKEVYQLMYAAISEKWAKNQCATHLITH